MTFTNFLNKYPESIKLFKVEKEVSLIVHGQGVFIFKSTNIFPCYFMVYNDDKTSGLRVEFTLDSLKVNEIPSNKPLIDENNVEGLSKIEGAYYWFSIDSQNMRLSAGIGEARIDTCIYDYTFMYRCIYVYSKLRILIQYVKCMQVSIYVCMYVCMI